MQHRSRWTVWLTRLSITLALGLVAWAQDAHPDLSGRWILDRDLTTADLSHNPVNSLVIPQFEDEVRFEYFDRDEKPLGSETFIPDNKERFRYVTRLVRAYARARWTPRGLSITTRAFLDAQGYQSYYEYDDWASSDDGKTLTEKSGDGKVMVFYKAESAKR